MSEILRRCLGLPLHYLYYLKVKDMASYDGIDARGFRYLIDKYEDGTLSATRAGLAWAAKKPGFDFLSLAPYRGYAYTNDVVYDYLRRFHETLEAEIERAGHALPARLDTPRGEHDRGADGGMENGLLEPLRSVMYELLSIDDADSFGGRDHEVVRRLQQLYSTEQLERVRLSLLWAVICHDFDFHSLLPDLPHSNEQILGHLTRFRETVEAHATRRGWPPVELG